MFTKVVMKYFIFGLSLVFLTSVANAQSTGIHVRVGTVSCGIVLENKDTDIYKYSITKFVQGYITGRNYERTLDANKQVKDVDFETLYFATIKYCEDNPIKNLADAATDTYQKLLMR